MRNMKYMKNGAVKGQDFPFMCLMYLLSKIQK